MDSMYQPHDPSVQDLKRYLTTMGETGCPECGQRGKHWKRASWGLEIQGITCGGCGHTIIRGEMARSIYSWNATGQQSAA